MLLSYCSTVWRNVEREYIINVTWALTSKEWNLIIGPCIANIPILFASIIALYAYMRDKTPEANPYLARKRKRKRVLGRFPISLSQFLTNIDPYHGPHFGLIWLWRQCRFGYPRKHNLFTTKMESISVSRRKWTIVNCNSKFPLSRQEWYGAGDVWCSITLWRYVNNRIHITHL